MIGSLVRQHSNVPSSTELCPESPLPVFNLPPSDVLQIPPCISELARMKAGRRGRDPSWSQSSILDGDLS